MAETVLYSEAHGRGGESSSYAKERRWCVRDVITQPGQRWWFKAVGMVVTLSIGLGTLGCGKEKEHVVQGEPQKLIVAVTRAPYSGLMAVADEKGFFQKAGLEVNLKQYASGLEGLQGVMRGEAQVATVADIAFASAMLHDPSLRVIAAIGASSGSRIVARKDRNIHEAADLAGKRIGYTPDTSSHYFLHSFLLVHQVPRKEVTMLAIPAARQVEAIASGEVDAISAFDANAYQARKKLAGNAVAWDAQNTVAYQWLLVTRESETQTPDAIQRLLRAVIMAEEFVLNDEAETRSILARTWNMAPDYLEESWHEIRLFVSFNQSIITALQSYVKWATARHGRAEELPDVLSYVDTGPLEAVDPKLVTIFR